MRSQPFARAQRDVLHAAIRTQVRNEIAVLKKVSSGHRNIVTLHDYFEVRSDIHVRTAQSRLYAIC